MKKYKTWLEKLERRVISQEFDRVIPVLADEGYGKSTLMVLTVYLRETEIKGRDLSVDDLFDHIVWDSADELRETITELPEQSTIAVMDAARMLNKKESMTEEQKEIEKDLFDIRSLGHVLLLGFQSPGTVPKDMADRRAKNALHLPSRGRIHGYSRSTLDDWNWETPYPDLDLKDSFPPLDGTELWEEFQRRDNEHKRQRVAPDEEEEGPSPAREAARKAKENLEHFVSLDGRDGSLYLDEDMIALEFETSEKQSRQARKLLQRDDDIEVRDDRVLLDGEVVREVDIDEDDSDEEEDSEPDLTDIGEEVYQNLEKFIGRDGRSGDFMLDPDLISIEFGLSDRKARKVRKWVESYEDVSISDDVVSVGGEVVCSESR